MHAVEAMLLAVLHLHLLLLVKIGIGCATVLLLVAHGADRATIRLSAVVVRVVMVRWRMMTVAGRRLHAHQIHAAREATGHATHAVLVLAALLTLATALLVVLLAKGVANVQLVLFEHEVLVFDAEYLVGVVLVLVGDEAVAARVAAWIGDDARVLHVTERREVLAQLVLVGCLWDTAHKDAVRYAVHSVVAVVIVVVVIVVALVAIVAAVAATASAITVRLAHTALSTIDKILISKCAQVVE